MKTKMIFSALMAICLVGVMAQIASAQDTIIKKDDDIIKANITEIGTEEIKFKLYNNPNGPTVVLKKSDVKTIKSAGQTIFDDKGTAGIINEDIIVTKNGNIIKAKVTDIGMDEVRFKLVNDAEAPTISMKKSDIKTMKIQGQTVIDVKTGLGEDMIIKKDGAILKAKISEIGANEITYKLYNNPDGPTMSIRKFDIKTIKIDGQIVYEYKADPLSVSNHSIIDKTSTLKFYFLSPLNHHIAFGYEWMCKPGFNWDVAMGIIGPGVIPTTNQNPRGLFLRGGPKFLLGNSSDVEMGDGDVKMRYAHPLKGKYIKVEMILNAFSCKNILDTGNYYYDHTNGSSYETSGQINYKKKCQSLTINLQYGRQYIFGNAMTLAWYGGLGYSFERKTSNLSSEYSDYEVDITRYSHTYFGKNFPVAFTAGITVGYIFKTPGWLANPTRHYKQGAQKKRAS